MIEAAIFDIGNVLLRFDYMRAAERLMEKNGLVELPDRAHIGNLVHEFESGKIDRAAFLAGVRPAFHDTGDPDAFVRIWEDIFDENVPMTALARDLSSAMPVYLISNISGIHLDFIRGRYDVFGVFTDGIFSFESGLMKPDPRVFQLARDRFRVNPALSVYFDDVAENCAAAAGEGFLVHHYDYSKHEAALAWLAGVSDRKG